MWLGCSGCLSTNTASCTAVSLVMVSEGWACAESLSQSQLRAFLWPFLAWLGPPAGRGPWRPHLSTASQLWLVPCRPLCFSLLLRNTVLRGASEWRGWALRRDDPSPGGTHTSKGAWAGPSLTTRAFPSFLLQPGAIPPPVQHTCLISTPTVESPGALLQPWGACPPSAGAAEILIT